MVATSSFQQFVLLWLSAVKTTTSFHHVPRRNHRIVLRGDNNHNEMASSPEEPVGVPRLHIDISSLMRWVEKAGGKFDANVEKQAEGWSLTASNDIEQGTVLLQIPKSLCIYANPKYMHDVSLLENTQELMSSLDPSQWRARLAVALLSERVRTGSHFRAYLRNLPFEFWGVPVFYSAEEFSIMQDLSLMQRTRDRCRFLSEFADTVLGPLRNNPRDPFSGHSADVHAFGWGFASAASRALRDPSVIKHADGQVMVPGIDIANHSSQPSCEVIDDAASNAFLLRAVHPISKGEAVTINYGPLCNEELLADYGFTVDGNPNDRVKLTCDAQMINIARLVMGQGNPDEDILNGGSKNGFNKGTTNSTVATIGRGGQRLEDCYLYNWQIYWLAALGLHGPSADFAMSIGTDIASVDPKLWAFLRILYAKDEEEITRHGYTPFTLQGAGSVLSAEVEMQVLKTMVGVVGVMLRVYGSDFEADLTALRSAQVDYDEESKAAGGASMLTATSDDIVSDVHRILRTILHVPHPAPTSPTVRRMNAAALAQLADEGTPAEVQRFREGIASASTPYRIAVGVGAGSEGKGAGVEAGVEAVAAGVEGETGAGDSSSEASRWSPSNVIANNEHTSEHTGEQTPSTQSPSTQTAPPPKDEDDAASSLESTIAGAAYVKASVGRLSPKVVADVNASVSAAAGTAAPPPAPAVAVAAVASGATERTASKPTRPATNSAAGVTSAMTDRPGVSLTDRPGVSMTDRPGVSLTDRPGVSLTDRPGVSLAPELLVDVSTLGGGLPINVREALRFRIRKKRALAQLVAALGGLYASLQEPPVPGAEEDSPNLLVGAGAGAGAGGGAGAGAGGSLLPMTAGMDRVERRARIRELLEEVRDKEEKREDLLVTSGRIANKWAERGLEL